MNSLSTVSLFGPKAVISHFLTLSWSGHFAENYEVFKSCPPVVSERNIVEVTKPQFSYEFLETRVEDQTEGECGKRVTLLETFS